MTRTVLANSKRNYTPNDDGTFTLNGLILSKRAQEVFNMVRSREQYSQTTQRFTRENNPKVDFKAVEAAIKKGQLFAHHTILGGEGVSEWQLSTMPADEFDELMPKVKAENEAIAAQMEQERAKRAEAQRIKDEADALPLNEEAVETFRAKYRLGGDYTFRFEQNMRRTRNHQTEEGEPNPVEYSYYVCKLHGGEIGIFGHLLTECAITARVYRSLHEKSMGTGNIDFKIQYKHIGLGGNGMDMGTAFFNADNEMTDWREAGAAPSILSQNIDILG